MLVFNSSFPLSSAVGVSQNIDAFYRRASPRKMNSKNQRKSSVFLILGKCPIFLLQIDNRYCLVFTYSFYGLDASMVCWIPLQNFLTFPGSLFYTSSVYFCPSANSWFACSFRRSVLILARFLFRQDTSLDNVTVSAEQLASCA